MRSVPTLLIVFLSSIFACVPPSGTGGPATSAGGAPPPVDDAASCDGACRNFDRCGVQPFEDCVAECGPHIPPEHLAQFTTASCEELAAAAAGSPTGEGAAGGTRADDRDSTDGARCASQGVNDCPQMHVCCNVGAGRAADQGEQGSCVQIALCG